MGGCQVPACQIVNIYVIYIRFSGSPEVHEGDVRCQHLFQHIVVGFASLEQDPVQLTAPDNAGENDVRVAFQE